MGLYKAFKFAADPGTRSLQGKIFLCCRIAIEWVLTESFLIFQLYNCTDLRDTKSMFPISTEKDSVVCFCVCLCLGAERMNQ